MRVTVFGANGKVGRLVVSLLLEHGHTVVAFAHSQSPFSANHSLVVIRGDIYDRPSVAAAINGSDAVISALGSWGTPNKDVLTAGAKHIILAMKAHKVRRIISLTGADARAPGDKLGLVHRFSHLILKAVGGKILGDGETHIKLLRDSGLDWTVVRSPAMNNLGDAERFKLSMKRPFPWATINRQSVASSLVDLLNDPGFKRQAPFIVRGR